MTCRIDPHTPADFVTRAFRPDDWIAILVKAHQTGHATQRVRPVSEVAQSGFLAWLRAANAGGSSIYVSVNAVAPRQRSRTRSALHAVRHVFLDADVDAAAVLARIRGSRHLPPPSYIIRSSRDRAHVLWRIAGCAPADAERLQKHLAQSLGTDLAATAATQLTRVPGFFNYKYRPPQLVSVTHARGERAWTLADFPPLPREATSTAPAPRPRRRRLPPSVTRRARRYLEALGPAVERQHGDAHTFRVCCRLVRGFALDDEEAYAVLAQWNRTCQPPWSERELRAKLRNARRYGHERIGGLLEASS